MKRFGFGGTDLVRCLLLRYEETGSTILFELAILGSKDQRRDALPLAGALSDKTRLRRAGWSRSLPV